MAWSRDRRCRVGMTGLLDRLRRGWRAEDAIATPAFVRPGRASRLRAGGGPPDRPRDPTGALGTAGRVGRGCGTGGARSECAGSRADSSRRRRSPCPSTHSKPVEAGDDAKPAGAGDSDLPNPGKGCASVPVPLRP